MAPAANQRALTEIAITEGLERSELGSQAFTLGVDMRYAYHSAN